MPLDEAIAELRRAVVAGGLPWIAGEFADLRGISGATPEAIATILNAACAGTMPMPTEVAKLVADAEARGMERAAERLDLAEHDAEERDWRSGANAFATLARAIRAEAAANLRAAEETGP